MAEPPADPAPGAPAAKPAILQDATFTVREGIAYRAMRTLAIWTNKLFFSSLVLWGVWLLMGAAQGDAACVETVRPVEGGNVTADEAATQCSVFLTPTSLYLGAAAVVSFALSILFGILGLVVGKDIVQASKAADEVGARRPPPQQP